MNLPSPPGPPGRVFRALWGYPRRAPLTFGYVCLLLATHVWVGRGLSADRAAGVLGYVSTSPDNLRDHPLAALAGSALFFDGTLTDVASTGFVGTLITLGLGVCCFLAWAEYRWGAPRAMAVFLGGHVAATLLTAVVIAVALRQGWYPPAVRQGLDFGVSYGAQAVLAVGTLALPRWGRPPWAVFVLGWPLGGAEWVAGPLPDFTTVGHLLAAGLGFGLAAVPAFRRRRVRAGGGGGGGGGGCPAARGAGPRAGRAPRPASQAAAGAEGPPPGG
ncbi:rhomboid-like protein [Streptomyces sp. TN58]|uniref:rhomboid-like protein n=1 Tax=Streptomyces sp. TN58 TaxID=234612 RepID=UPI000AC334D6|nr:rhomboid-like protein [Streptomyces sp. TN58]